mmetsp:Transcript_24239/g.91465  ORF Transcript_24239/g.91465 Transcript_24239/m.91465 type:complete len:326 (+) Transcript_24239:441-1418(+)
MPQTLPRHPALPLARTRQGLATPPEDPRTARLPSSRGRSGPPIALPTWPPRPRHCSPSWTSYAPPRRPWQRLGTPPVPLPPRPVPPSAAAAGWQLPRRLLQPPPPWPPCSMGPCPLGPPTTAPSVRLPWPRPAASSPPASWMTSSTGRARAARRPRFAAHWRRPCAGPLRGSTRGTGCAGRQGTRRQLCRLERPWQRCSWPPPTGRCPPTTRAASAPPPLQPLPPTRRPLSPARCRSRCSRGLRRATPLRSRASWLLARPCAGSGATTAQRPAAPAHRLCPRFRRKRQKAGCSARLPRRWGGRGPRRPRRTPLRCSQGRRLRGSP